MNSDKAKQIKALMRLLEECRNRAVELQIDTVTYLIRIAETSISEDLLELEGQQTSSGPTPGSRETASQRN